MIGAAGAVIAVMLGNMLPPLIDGGRAPAGSLGTGMRDGEPHAVAPSASYAGRTGGTRVLLVVDTSGSMRTRMSDAAAMRRISAAVQGAVTGVRVLPGSYEVGLWEMRGPGHFELVSVARLDKPGHRARLVRALDGLLDGQRADPGTPLFTTTKNAIQSLEGLAGSAGTRNVVVMVTDAGDHPPRALLESGRATTSSQLDRIVSKTAVDVHFTAAYPRCDALLAKLPSLPTDRCYPVESRRDISPTVRSILETLTVLGDGRS